MRHGRLFWFGHIFSYRLVSARVFPGLTAHAAAPYVPKTLLTLALSAFMCISSAHGQGEPEPSSAATVFSNTNPISIPLSGVAILYPSTITVSGIGSNTTTGVVVTLNNFSHTWAEDLDILLVGPQGQRSILMSDVGSSSDIINANMSFDQQNGSLLPVSGPLGSGPYLPKNLGSPDDFPAPGPGLLDTEPADLSVFDGTNPNGVWSLYVVDDSGGDGGTIAVGWSLTIDAPTLFTVTTIDDTDDTVCGAHCSLREAINAANSNGGAVQIGFNFLFGVKQTINLTSTLPDITSDIKLIGPGADLLTVRRYSGGDYKIFTILPAADNVDLSGLTISNGHAPNSLGGGIYAANSNLVLTNVAVTGNEGASGGGVYLASGHGVFTNCTFSGNLAKESSAIFFSGNDGYTLQLVNTTISNNAASNPTTGASVAHISGSGASTLEVISSTIAHNDGLFGSSIYTRAINPGATATTKLQNTIVAQRRGSNLATEEISGGVAVVTSLGYNLSTDSGGGFLTGNGDQVNTDPLLGPLSNNGGALQTHALKFGSPALDKGINISQTTDQRGAIRTFDIINIGAAYAGDHTDIGAVEMQALIVTNANDSGAGSLRQAMLDASSNGPGLDDILFNLPFFAAPRTINLASSLPAIGNDMNFYGPGANRLTVQRNSGGDYRLLSVDTGLRVSVNDLMLKNGYAVGASGGGIHNLGSLTINSSALVENATTDYGGAVFNEGILTINNSSIYRNTAQKTGGGVYNLGNADINLSTFSDNQATYGGGIQNYAHSVNLLNSTVFGNTAITDGGGITSYGDSTTFTTLINTIASDNHIDGTNTPSDLALYVGLTDSFISGGYNLVTVTGAGINFGAPGDQIGFTAQLDELSDNGGPTLTHLPPITSRAIDRGKCGSSGVYRDQRGFNRPFDVVTVVDSGDGCDVGAVEWSDTNGDGYDDGQILFSSGFE